MNFQVATFWSVVALLVLSVTAIILFGRVLHQVKRLSEATAAYAVTIEDDLRKTRHAMKNMIAALRLADTVDASVWFSDPDLNDAVARFAERYDDSGDGDGR